MLCTSSDFFLQLHPGPEGIRDLLAYGQIPGLFLIINDRLQFGKIDPAFFI